MRRLRVPVYAWVVAAALGGCAAGEAESSRGEVRVTSPELVPVSPGVQVIADADEPLFYADGYYWLYRDNIWLRSDNYRGGFARIDANLVPNSLRTIPQPQGYAHYRRGTGRAIARPSQQPQRAPTQPQGTQQYPQQPPQQPQQPMQPMPQQPMQPMQPMQQQPQQPQQPMQPMTQQPEQPQPTEPIPSSPDQKPPVPNPMPDHD